MRSMIIIIIIIMIIMNVNARYHNTHNYVQQIDKTIIESCNIKTYRETNNEPVYKCIVDKNKNCNIITGYNEYNKIMYNCIDDKRSICGSGVFIAIVTSFLIAMYNMY